MRVQMRVRVRVSVWVRVSVRVQVRVRVQVGEGEEDREIVVHGRGGPTVPAASCWSSDLAGAFHVGHSAGVVQQDASGRLESHTPNSSGAFSSSLGSSARTEPSG